MNIDDIKPAGYTTNSKSESKSIKVLENLLDDNFIASYLSKNDKTPNHDGNLDILEDDIPLGTLQVQVKTLKANYPKPSYPIKLSLLSYIRNGQLPFLFIAVDQLNKKAFWQFIDRKLAVDLINEALSKNIKQKSISISFDVNNEVKTNPPYAIWKTIVIDHVKSIIESEKIYYDLILSNKIIENLKLDLNSIDKKSEYINLNLFIDKFNTLLNNDFVVVKSLFVKDFWKLGIIIFGTSTSTKLAYSMFQVELDENVKLIKVHPDEDYQKFITDFRSVRAYFGSNPIFNNPVKYAYDKIGEYLKILLERKILWPNNEILKTEFLFNLKETSYRDHLDIDPVNINLTDLKSKIEFVISKLPKTQLDLMKSHSFMNNNLFRALDYIQDFRLDNIQKLNRLSPTKFTLHSIINSLNIDNVALEQISPILKSYYTYLFKAYEQVLDEYFPQLKDTLSYEKYNFIINPIIFYPPDDNNEYSIKIISLRIFRLEKLSTKISDKIVIEPNSEILKMDFENDIAIMNYNKINYRFFESTTINLSELFDDLPIRKGIYKLLKVNLELFFKQNIK